MILRSERQKRLFGIAVSVINCDIADVKGTIDTDVWYEKVMNTYNGFIKRGALYQKERKKQWKTGLESKL